MCACSTGAHDIRTVANSCSSLAAQVKEVATFTNDNFLTLNPSKCEILCLSRGGSIVAQCCVNGNPIPVRQEVKCLGYVWNGSLSADQMVEYNCNKARRAFFASGSIGGFQGSLSPLSGKSLIETCVLPVVLYGCENWRLTTSSLARLDSLIGELCKRVLKLPKWYCNTPARMALGWPSMRAMCLVRKLCLLLKLMDGDAKSANLLGAKTLEAFGEDKGSTLLVRECVELEESYGTVFVENICKVSDDCPSGRYMKETIYNLDRETLISDSKSRSDTVLLARIEKKIDWCKLWDLCRDHGPKSVVGLRAFLRIIVHPAHANKCCPKCDIDKLDASLLSHVIVDHSTCSLF